MDGRKIVANAKRVGIRWTVGNATVEGFEALRLSIWGAWKIFGPDAEYVVCTNRISAESAHARAGDVPPPVRWQDVTGLMPAFLHPHVDSCMADGVAWKLAPVRVFEEQFEIALDNDCILWEMPAAIRLWLQNSSFHRTTVLAEDVALGFGQFAHLCKAGPRNSGIRGLPPNWDYERELRGVLEKHPVILQSELDEQGLQTASLSRERQPLVVTVEEVSICSPFPPHLPQLGSCGAHFCGLNAHHIPWEWQGRPATEHIRAHWRRHREMIYEKIGIRSSVGC